MSVGGGDLIGRPVVLDGKSATAQGALEAPVPMEVDPVVRLLPSGDLEFESRPTYAQIVAGTRPIGQLPAPLHGRAGIEGALRDEALSSGRPLEWSTECIEEPLFIQRRSRPIKLVQSGQPLSPATVSLPVKGVLPPNVLEALSELEDRYSFVLPTGDQGLALATETSDVSGALVLGELLMDLDVPEGNPGQALMSAEALCEHSLSSCPDSGTEDSVIEDRASCRWFSCLLSKRLSAGGPLLARVQRHWLPATASSSAVNAGEANGPRTPKSRA